jgi:hypothetical protein
MRCALRAGIALIAVLAASMVGVSPTLAATHAPAWSVQTIAQPTSFSAADSCENLSHSFPSYRSCDRYTVAITNIGTQASNGTVTVTDTLPAGLVVSYPPGGIDEITEFSWSCETNEVASRDVVTCTTERSVPALTAAPVIEIPVTVSPTIAAGSLLSNEATVAGGEAGTSATAVTATPIAAPSAPAPAGPFAPLSFSFAALGQAGAPDTQAGGHPGALTTSFLFPSANLVKSQVQQPFSVEYAKQIVTDLPPGLVGDALAAPTCSLADVTDLEQAQTQCPSSTRIGTLFLIMAKEGNSDLTIFNVTPEHGYAAEFALFLPSLERATLLYATLVGSGADTHVRVTSAPIPDLGEEFNLVGSSLTFFGNPAAIDGTPLTPVAFATNPSDCAASSFSASLYVDTWEHPGKMEADGEPDLSDPNWKGTTSVTPAVTGCETLQFDPKLGFAPEREHSQADEPAGYESVLQIPQNEDPNGLATPPLRTTAVTLPAGVAISPAAANGLVACQETGAEGIELESNQPGHCPAASTVGQVEITTPLLAQPLQGSVFVAQPACGGAGQAQCTEEAAETGDVFALYLEVGSASTGIHLKLKGSVEVGGSSHHNDLAPGQIRATFTELPQQPFNELRLRFKGGAGAPLANPQACGSFSSLSSLTPWSASAEASLQPSSSFTIAGCTNGFAPSFEAGTTNPQAGQYSPFSLTFSRQDREQDLAGVTVNLPEGLLGKIAGIAQCPDAQANTGTCPASSRIGTATAAAGSGAHPLWQSGSVYLTGPYNGAPFGLSVVVPAQAGPYDLGDIVVRAAIHIDPHTAQVSVISDPLPQSVDGVPLRVKTVNVTVGDQGNFVFNPTSCAPMAVTGTLSSSQGASAQVSSRFQVSGCRELPFKPSFKVSTQAKTSKQNGASLDVKVGSGAGQANIGKVVVSLPKQLPSRLTTIQQACPEATFAANPASCPAGSNIGTATAQTPVLAQPVTGPAYLVSHGGAAFPDVVIILQGEGITLDLVGNIDIKHGVTSSAFSTIPDTPISSFELMLPEGPHSALTTALPAKAKGNLCGTRLTMPTAITGQNGAQIEQNTQIAITGCAKAKRAPKHRTKHKPKHKARHKQK